MHITFSQLSTKIEDFDTLNIDCHNYRLPLYSTECLKAFAWTYNRFRFNRKPHTSLGTLKCPCMYQSRGLENFQSLRGSNSDARLISALNIHVWIAALTALSALRESLYSSLNDYNGHRRGSLVRAHTHNPLYSCSKLKRPIIGIAN